ncbi:MAG TPA: FKBP-type peptidyl-prolyl cis-trans isomerase [Bacteroidia bacterium]|jgi:FKBP-type peptidyl-prolyl cis-trans isomerase FkpA|nr:FKBP-type peptidyl-prolyl cis-trans isomerase [Bacteroidia bacterium]
MIKHAILFAGLGASLLVSCSSDAPPPKHKQYTKDQLLTANRVDAHRESDDIDAYILHHHYVMKGSGTGLRYMFIQHSIKGDSVHSGQFAKVAYTVFLLDGTLCYSSAQDGQREFRVGEDHVESGIHEAVMLMKTGDKLRFILPSNLAHGLLGDGDKIPPRAPVLYEVELISVR